MIGRRRATPILVAAALAAGSLLVASPGPAVGSDGACPGATGVTVVVDYNALGGGVVVRCAPGSPSSGFKALSGAGFLAVQAGAGFLCRIDGKPGPDEEDCANTPPPTAYWSYWHADRGGSWIYSPWGADHRPDVGSVEGWSFHTGSGAASKPGVAPPAPAPTPSPKPTPKPTPRPTPKPTPRPTATAAPTVAPTARPSGAATPAATASPSATPAASPGSSPGSSSLAASAPPTPSLATASDPPSSETAQPSPLGGAAGVDDPSGSGGAAGAATTGGGPPLGTLVGLGLVLLVGAGALSARYRRSARGTGDG